MTGKRIIILSVVLSALSVIGVACHKLPTQSPRKNPDEKTIGAIILEGMSFNEVVKRMGEPTSIEDAPDNYRVMTYMFKHSPRPPAKHFFSGFQVWLRGETVEEWRPIYADMR